MQNLAIKVSLHLNMLKGGKPRFALNRLDCGIYNFKCTTSEKGIFFFFDPKDTDTLPTLM